jgi:WD40 repeat protein
LLNKLHQRQYNNLYLLCIDFISITPPTIYAEMALADQNGSHAPFAPGYPKIWGSEVYKLIFSQRVNCISCSLPSHKLLAVTSGRDIEIYNSQTVTLVDTLSGHDENVDVVKFLDENVLASSDDTGSGTVIIWKLDNEGRIVHNSSIVAINIDELAVAAADTVLENIRMKEDVGTELDERSRTNLISTLTPAIASFKRQHIRGRELSFNGMLFSFGSDPWLRVSDVESDSIAIDSALLLYKTRENYDSVTFLQLTLNQNEGEDQAPSRKSSTKTYQPAPEDQATDHAIWSGISPNRKMLAVVSWDQYARIYATPLPLTNTSEPASLKLLYKMGPTGGQNWTGAWHPSSEYFAFSQGSPKTAVHVYRIPFSGKSEGETGQPELIHSLSEFSGWCRSMAWSPDGKTLLCVGRGKALLYNPFTSTIEREFPYVPEAKSTDKTGNSKVSRNLIAQSEGRNAQWISQSKCLWTTGDAAIEMFDRDEELRYRWEPAGEDKWNYGYWSDQIVLTGGKMVTADGDNSIRVWEFPGSEDSKNSI